MDTIILDVASAPLENAGEFLEGTVKPPANYKDSEKIALYVQEKEAERLEKAAVDVDLARLTGAAMILESTGEVNLQLFRTEAEEVAWLELLADLLPLGPRIVTYGGFYFDLPLIQRRARYLGVKMPRINIDRYRSPHVDLCEDLSDHNPQRRRPLAFYAKRLGLDLTKPLSGAEEARVHETGQWDALEASLLHDVTATRAVAEFWGIV